MNKRQFFGMLAGTAATATAAGAQTIIEEPRPLREKVQKDGIPTILEWYHQLITEDAEIKAQFEKLTLWTRDEVKAHVFTEKEPYAVAWLPQDDLWGRKHYDEAQGYLIFHPIGFAKSHLQTMTEIIVSEGHQVSDIIEDDERNRTVKKVTLQFWGFRTLKLEPVA